MNEATVKRRKAMGLCVGCGGKIEPSRGGKQKCEACAKKASDAKKEAREYCKRLGLCTKCRRKLEPDREGKSLCEACAKKQGEYQRASNERRAGK